MSTFKELADKKIKAVGRKEVYQYIVDHLTDNFVSNGKPAKQVLVSEGMVRVDETIVDEVVQEILNAIGFLDKEIALVDSSQLAPVTQTVVSKGEGK